MKKLFPALFLFSLLLSCTDSNRSDDMVACTEELRTISVGVQHKDGSPYALDSVKTFIETEVGLKDINIFNDFDSQGFKNCREDGIYPVTGDGLTRHYPDFVMPTKWDEVKLVGVVIFVGYKDDKELFRKNIKVYTDACHVFCDEKDLAVIDLE
ncbi:hypothetical protein D0T84_18890 [Dysgonomonas sp. 521]|uniref:hypothetical protein n=1 Tax=Dysgonomonas sp. 521 TaxID=2302932 RepID=UPI0013D78C79|nr:hypothetical protein [Dysgonomonas sp. 521]NDV96956.1 hypothetical protein [Dysgonomonas sp. 521]